MSYFKTNDGAEIYYEIYGEGKPLVMIHGWDQSSKSFCKNVPELSKKYKVITIDMRGHGESSKPTYGYRLSRFAKDVKDLFDFLDLEDVTMLGWSMGSCVMWSYWDMYRDERLSKFIIVDEAPLVLTTSYSPFGFVDYEGLIGLRDALLANPKETTRSFSDSMIVTDEGKKEHIDWVTEESLKLPTEQCAFLLMNHVFTNWSDVIPTITLPTLIIHADKSVNQYDANHWHHEHIKGSRFEVFETGHMMFLEEPEKFNKLIEEFIG